MRPIWLSFVILLAAEFPAEPIGRWELVGVGDVDGNVAGSDRLTIALNASGSFDYQLWSDGDAGQLTIAGRWSASGDVLKLWPRDAESLKATDQVYRVGWDGPTLLLHPEEDGTRDPVPLRFARRIDGAP